jgi:hypothetical protein
VRGWSAGARPRRVAAIGLAVLALTGVGWAVLSSTGPGARDARAGAAVAAASSTLPEPARETVAGPRTLEDWRSVVDELYQRRAAAFATPSPELLTDVYPEGSALLAADIEVATGLAGAGEASAGSCRRSWR